MAGVGDDVDDDELDGDETAEEGNDSDDAGERVGVLSFEAGDKDDVVAARKRELNLSLDADVDDDADVLEGESVLVEVEVGNSGPVLTRRTGGCCAGDGVDGDDAFACADAGWKQLRHFRGVCACASNSPHYVHCHYTCQHGHTTLSQHHSLVCVRKSDC